MSTNTMTYKGYTAGIEYSQEDGLLVGRVLGIRDSISFHGESVAEVQEDFRNAIESYLESCIEWGVPPDSPDVDEVNLLLPSTINSRLTLAAEATGRTPGEIVAELIRKADLESEPGKSSGRNSKGAAGRIDAKAKAASGNGKRTVRAKAGKKIQTKESVGK